VDAALASTGFRTAKAPVTSASRDVRRTIVAHDPRWDRSEQAFRQELTKQLRAGSADR
jgi:hypothetical protein